jgi:hypothetical protein
VPAQQRTDKRGDRWHHAHIQQLSLDLVALQQHIVKRFEHCTSHLYAARETQHNTHTRTRATTRTASTAPLRAATSISIAVTASARDNDVTRVENNSALVALDMLASELCASHAVADVSTSSSPYHPARHDHTS